VTVLLALFNKKVITYPAFFVVHFDLFGFFLGKKKRKERTFFCNKKLQQKRGK
jgi:hypothetical protein